MFCGRRGIVKYKKIVPVLLLAVLGLLAGIAAASGSGDGGTTYYHVPKELNLLYDGEATLPDEAPAALAEETASSVEVAYHDTREEAAAELREEMKKRQNVITIGCRTAEEFDWGTFGREIFAIAIDHTGEPSEGDTLAWAWRDRELDISSDRYGELWYVRITYTVNYYTTSAMEAELDRAVAALLRELELYDSSDYEKTKGIYDYICANVKYDRANASDAGYTLKYTPYAALINKTAVCQGIALLYYRLACELELDTRIIFGKSGSVNHTWLVVKLGDSYYYLDPTWDAGRISYRYFLKGEDGFTGHKRIDNPICGLFYTSPAFYAAYPVSVWDFNETSIPEDGVSGALGDHLTWRLTADGRLVIGGEGGMEDFAPSDVPWKEYSPFIREIVIGRGVSHIGAFAFYDCTQVETVSLPHSAITVDENAFSSVTAVVYAQKKPLSLIDGAPCIIAESADSTRYLIADELPRDIVSLASFFDLGAADRVQILSSDGMKRHTSIAGADVGVRIQLLNGTGGVADELTVALRGDFDLDGDVDEADAVFLLWSFLKPQTYCSVPHYDLNGDGMANASDAVFGEQ